MVGQADCRDLLVLIYPHFRFAKPLKNMKEKMFS